MTGSRPSPGVGVGVVALVAAASLVLTGCHTNEPLPGEGGSALAKAVKFTSVKVPAAMTTPTVAPAAWNMSMVPAAGNLPRLAVGLVSSGESGAAQVRVWASMDAAAPLQEQKTIGSLVGHVASVSAAGSQAVSSISGYAWDGRTDNTFLLTSTDRTAWTPVKLDARARAVRADTSSVDGRRLVLAGDGLLGRHPAVVVYSADSGKTVTTALAAPGDNDAQTVTGVAVGGDVIVVTAQRGPEGGLRTPVSYMSTDAGTTFGAPQKVTASVRGDVSGVVWTGTQFVATGSDRAAGATDNRPASWSSANGTNWAPENITPFGADPLGWAKDSDPATFSRPTVTNGEVAVVTTQKANPIVYLRYRQADGTWMEPVGTDEQDWAYLDACAVRTGTGFSAVVEENGSVAEILTRDGQTPTRTVLANWVRTVRFLSLNDLTGAVAVAAGQPAFSFVRKDDGSYNWRQYINSALYTFTKGAFTEQPWGPSDLATHHAPVTGTDKASGTSVIAAQGSTANGFPMHAWVRLKGGDWQPVVGIGEAPYQEPTVIEKTSAGWLMAATVAQTMAFSDARIASLWSSVDGVTWTKAPGRFQTDSGQKSEISAICELPDGPMAVGWADDADQISHATAWQMENNQWAPYSLTNDPGSTFSSCVATSKGARISGSNGSQSITWKTSDLKSYPVVETLDRGITRHAPVKVDGGFAATGSIESETYTGSVLWFSTDGVTWKWVKIPTTTRSADLKIAPIGGDLLVTAQTSCNAQAWTVPDIAAVLRVLAG